MPLLDYTTSGLVGRTVVQVQANLAEHRPGRGRNKLTGLGRGRARIIGGSWNQEASIRKRKPMLTTEPWPLNEVSTRNCRHCLAPKEGVFVRCRRGHSMVGDYDRHKRRLSYNGVITASRLLKPCQGCADFDNDWN